MTKESIITVISGKVNTSLKVDDNIFIYFKDDLYNKSKPRKYIVFSINKTVPNGVILNIEAQSPYNHDVITLSFNKIGYFPSLDSQIIIIERFESVAIEKKKETLKSLINDYNEIISSNNLE